MSVKVVFIIIAIIFYVVRQLSKNNDTKPMPKAKNAPRQANTQQSSSPKSIDDIFNDFVKEVESVKKKEVKPVQVAQKNLVTKKPALDWQQVDRTHLKAQKQLINHDDYHLVSHRVDKAHQSNELSDIASTEGEVFDFNIEDIDWHKAIIHKEILDRKYA